MNSYSIIARMYYLLITKAASIAKFSIKTEYMRVFLLISAKRFGLCTRLRILKKILEYTYTEIKYWHYVS